MHVQGKGEKGVLVEFEQLYDKGKFSPIYGKNLTPQQKQNRLCKLMFLKQKRDR